ncbi:MAG: hypothetical protein H7Z71_10090 [Moraxellaceae bacterium]|nr:hypothetical protein [Pseudobdellovibrionaceae bacterium]
MKMLKSLKNRFKKNITNNERGQGATEYILLLVVIVGLVTVFGGKIKTAFNTKIGEVTNSMDSITVEK